jgi:chromosome segregation ATPase
MKTGKSSVENQNSIKDRITATEDDGVELRELLTQQQEVQRELSRTLSRMASESQQRHKGLLTEIQTLNARLSNFHMAIKGRDQQVNSHEARLNELKRHTDKRFADVQKAFSHYGRRIMTMEGQITSVSNSLYGDEIKNIPGLLVTVSEMSESLSYLKAAQERRDEFWGNVRKLLTSKTFWGFVGGGGASAAILLRLLAEVL